jgi:hypothetical protein
MNRPRSRCAVVVLARCASNAGLGLWPCFRVHACLTAPSRLALFVEPLLRPRCGPVICKAVEVVGAADRRLAALSCGLAVVDPCETVRPPLASVRSPIREAASRPELPDTGQSSSPRVGGGVSAVTRSCTSLTREPPRASAACGRAPLAPHDLNRRGGGITYSRWRSNFSAPDGQRCTCATTSSAAAASGTIHGLRLVSKTAGCPRTQLPECTQTSGSKLTSTSIPT